MQIYKDIILKRRIQAIFDILFSAIGIRKTHNFFYTSFTFINASSVKPKLFSAKNQEI